MFGWLHRVRRGIPDLSPEQLEIQQLRQALAQRDAEYDFIFQLLGKLTLFNESLESTQASLAGMATRLQSERQSAQAAVGQTASGRAEVESMASTLDSLAGRSARSAGSVGELDERAAKIVGAVDTIRDIASHIKLLSLNAAVEAARAGQHGAGFAVVAHEVRSLAEKSSAASGSITKLAAGIRDVSGAARTEIAELAAGAQDHSDRGKSVIATMQNVMGIAGELEVVVASSSLRSFIELAKLDHLVFKFKVYRALLGQLELEPSGLASHHACRLGKWYYEGEGRSAFSHLHGYREIERPHRIVHEAAVQALELSRQGGDTQQVVERVDAMEHASLDVLAALERMAVAGVDELDLGSQRAVHDAPRATASAHPESPSSDRTCCAA